MTSSAHWLLADLLNMWQQQWWKPGIFSRSWKPRNVISTCYNSGNRSAVIKWRPEVVSVFLSIDKGHIITVSLSRATCVHATEARGRPTVKSPRLDTLVQGLPTASPLNSVSILVVPQCLYCHSVYYRTTAVAVRLTLEQQKFRHVGRGLQLAK